MPAFRELADVRTLAGLAADAEAAGWGGFFVWATWQRAGPGVPLAATTVALTAIAVATERTRSEDGRPGTSPIERADLGDRPFGASYASTSVAR